MTQVATAHPHALALTEHERERKWPNLRPRDAGLPSLGCSATSEAARMNSERNALATDTLACSM